MTLLAGDELSQEPKLRLLQIQELLRADIGPMAVYYDQAGLRPDGAAKLDVRYIPVRVKTGGLFHPKVVLLLTAPIESNSPDEGTLVFGVLSANLTKNGWWSSLECACFEVIRAGAVLGLHGDLLRLLRDVRALSDRDAGHGPLDHIRKWVVSKTTQSEHATWEGRLRTRLIAGTRPFLDFLADARADKLDGCSLEIISPFFDERDPKPLSDLAARFGIRETRVFLPTARDGAASCTPELYSGVRDIPHTEWAKLPDDLLRLGKDANATTRGVHAKVYRFTKRSQRYEALVVGSHNLTTAAHQTGGNFEASFLLEREDAGGIDWWLEVQRRRPSTFEPAPPNDDDSAAYTVVPLQISFDWIKKQGEVRWDGTGVARSLRLEATGSHLFTIDSLPPGHWAALTTEQSTVLEKTLVSTSILNVSYAEEFTGSVLVQENGMSRKPSLVISFSISDILAYWSRLTMADRAAYLEAHFQGTIPEGWSSGDVIRRESVGTSGFFETFAGIFHGFDMLRRQVSESLAMGNERKADYLLFGQRHDSLPHIIEKVSAADDQADALSRYLVLLCARQMLQEMQRSDHPFYADRRRDIGRLLEATRQTVDFVRSLSLGDDGERFLEWFEAHFLKRVEAPPVEADA